MRYAARSTVLAFLATVAVQTAPRAQEILAAIPPELHGSWGSDCASPEMVFEAAALVQRGDRVKNPVRQVVRREGEIDIHYDRPADKVTVVDTYRFEGSTLRLTASRYGAMQTTWNKRPWQRCGAVQRATQTRPAGRRYPVVASIPIGPWTVTSNNDQAGVFAHCELTRRDGTLTFGMTRGKGGYVMFLANPAWTELKAGAKYDLTLQGSGLAARSVSATSVDAGVVALLGTEQQLIDQMKRLNRLDVRTAQTVISVPMNLADAALTELETCWVQNSGTTANPFAR